MVGFKYVNTLEVGEFIKIDFVLVAGNPEFSVITAFRHPTSKLTLFPSGA